MTTTETTSPKKTRKRKAKAEDSPALFAGADPEKTVARIHEGGTHTLAIGEDGLEPTSPVRELPQEEAADAAAGEERGSALAAIVQRALRFGAKEGALLRVLPGRVECGGLRGSAIIPWSVPSLPDAGVVVDGRKLHRALRAAGDQATIQYMPSSSRLEIRFGSRRFTLATVDGAQLDILRPPTENITYGLFKTAVFRTALVFAGEAKIEPIDLSGVNISRGGCVACDRRGLIAAFDALDDSAIDITLPADAFDDLSDVVYFGVDVRGHAVIADPSGEWRVIVSIGTNPFPPVRDVLARWDCGMQVEVDKAEFVGALKQFRIVQSAGSSVKLNVWTAPPTTSDGAPNPNAGDWLEMRGGDPANICDFTARMGVRIARRVEVDSPGAASTMFSTCIALDELLKLAHVHVGSHVRLGFGSTPRDPVVVKGTVFEAGVMPMVG